MSEKITLQMIFDAGWQAFVVEKQKPAYKNGKCCYLTSDGRRCVVGLALPDDVAQTLKDVEMSFSELLSDYEDLFADSLLAIERSHLEYFQDSLHDNQVDGETEDWKNHDYLRPTYLRIARYFDLKIPEERKSQG